MRTITGILILLFISMSHFANAQNDLDSLLFSENTKIYKHKFNIDLPNNINIQIELLNLNDWQKGKLFKNFKSLAGQHINHYKGEMEQAETDVFNMIIRNHTVNDYQKIIFSSRKPMQSEVVFRNNEYYNLKTETDNFQYSEIFADSFQYGINEIKLPSTILYTIRTNSLLDLLALDETVFTYAQNKMDSLIVEVQSKVRNPKANWYNTQSYINLKRTDSSYSTLNYNKGLKQFTKNIRFGVNYGVVVFGSSISPTIEIAMGWVSNTKGTVVDYAGVNFSMFTNFNIDRNGFMNVYVPIFLEYGRIKNKIGFIQGKTSVGFGLVNKAYEGNAFYLPGVQLNFAISNTISTSFIMASEWKKNAEHHIWAITLKYNL